MVSLIMRCISTSTMRVSWDKEVTDSFIPTRGIRQGDPISLYLFVLCMERLPYRIILAVGEGEWKPIRIAKQCLRLTHLFFAHNITLFAEANMKQACVIQKVMRDFYGQSGQKISLNTSLLHISANVNTKKAKKISDFLGINLTNDLGRYLGIPFIHGKITKKTFKLLLDKVYSRLVGSKAKVLSMTRRITLIKSMTLAIPGYVMQTTKIRKAICDSIDKCNRSFLQGDNDQKRHVHLVSWKEMCKPKANGGLGIRLMRQTNSAMLAKLGWRIITSPDSLWA